jgi:cytochrome c-type biogenesis protein CcmH/NrfG
MRSRILWPAGALALLWIALPVQLPNPSTGPAEEQCLTLPDTPPDPTRTDLIAVLEHCSARHPTDVELMADLGRLYEWSDRSTDAEAQYRRALSIDPGYGDLRLRLGRLLLKRGDAAAARREAASALTVQTNRRAILELLQDAKTR